MNKKTLEVVIGASMVCIGMLTESAYAATVTYSDRALFESSVGPVQIDNFESYIDGQTITNLFGGLATFNTTQAPTIFAGSFTPGPVAGNSLIPEPRFNTTPLVISFSTPVNAVGADLFDDYDGSPVVNTLSLSVTTSLGNIYSISENSGNFQVGFLGIQSTEGITEARFLIDGFGGNLEIDSLTVSSVPVPAAIWMFGSGLLGLVGVARHRKSQ